MFNFSSNKTKTDGITVDSLKNLDLIKSLDKKHTMLSFLIK